MRSLRLANTSTEAGESDSPDLPDVQAGPGAAPKRVSLPPAVSKAGGNQSQESAIRQIFDFAGKGQGWRVVSIGATGSGKTWFQRKVVQLSSQRDNYVLIHDAKDRVPQYGGAIRDSVFSLHRQPVAHTNIIVFRHEDPERVSEMAWQASARGATSLVVIDELYDALKSDRCFKDKRSRIDEIYRKGRSRGVSILSSTQIPQALPTVTISLCDFKVIFKLDARALTYAEQAFRLTPDLTEKIRRLQVGQFVLVQQGVDWNGVVYGPA